MARDFAKKFYKSKEWQGVREYVIRRDKYLCTKCGNPAQEVHHIKHLSEGNIDDVSIALDEKNLISLCRECHFKEHKHKKAEEVKEGYEFDEDGYLVAPLKKQGLDSKGPMGGPL